MFIYFTFITLAIESLLFCLLNLSSYCNSQKEVSFKLSSEELTKNN